MKRERRILKCLADLRERHPEFGSRLTWTGLQRVLERDEIVVVKAPIRESARMTAMGGVGVLTFNSSLPAREWLYAGAHEYAHWALHHDQEPTRHGFVSYSRDRREPEADYLAEWLLRGPEAKPAPSFRESWPAPRMVPAPARPQHAAHLVVRVHVPPAFDPYATPAATAYGRLTPRYGGLAGETPLQCAMRHARPLRRELRMGPASDYGVVEHSPGRVRYIDREGVRWTVWDVVVRDGAKSVVPGGAAGARLRHFVNILGVQRTYQFANKHELRDVAERHLERQLRDATLVTTASPRRVAAGGST